MIKCLKHITKIGFIAVISLGLIHCSIPDSNHVHVDSGQTKNGVYVNRYFGFSIKKPAKWVQLDDRQKQIAAKKEARLVAGKNREMEHLLDPAHSSKLNLFSWFQYSLGSTLNRFNPSIIAVAERLNTASSVNNSADYLDLVKNLMKRSAVSYTFSKPVSKVVINKTKMALLELEVVVAGIKIKQRYYVSLIKGYALTFVLSWQSADQFQMIEKSFKTLGYQLKH